MGTVALILHPGRPEAERLADDAVTWLEGRGHRARVLRLVGPDRIAEGGEACDLSGVDLTGTDLAVSLGGDGTFLRLVTLAYPADVPVMGVNFGRLGYLLEVAPDRLSSALDRALAGDLPVQRRSALAVSVEGEVQPAASGDRSLAGDLDVDAAKDRSSHPNRASSRRATGRWWLAFNEMVVEKTVPGHMVHLSTAVDGAECLSYKADGILVATPTGSTAYNLSAGGPVLAPQMQAMVLTPVAPHLSVSVSLVLEADRSVTITVLEPLPAVLVVDGQEVGRISPMTSVRVRIAHRPVRVVSLGERDFAGLLHSTIGTGFRR
jgi:NAD+ kinase